MALRFVPGRGRIVICRFDRGFVPPEMVKTRPFVVIAPRPRSTRLVTGVPLSATPPEPAEPWHHRMSPASYPATRKPLWAKCDMIATVSLDRLDRVKTRDADGNRVYRTFVATQADLDAIAAGVRAHLQRD